MSSGSLTIRGLGVVGGFGSGRQALAAALRRPPAAAPTFRADLSALADFVDRSSLRRVDHFSQMAVLAAAQALREADLPGLRPDRVGVILASGYGPSETTFQFLDGCPRFGGQGASPTLFSGSGQSGALASLTILLGLRGRGLTVCQPQLAVPAALLTARLWLQEGSVDAVLVGGVDEHFALRAYTWGRLFGQGGRGPLRPLEFGRQSAVAGEGGAFLLLTAAAPAGGPLVTLDTVVCGGPAPTTADAAGVGCVLLGADGQRRCGRLYRQAIPVGVPVAAYTPLFGSLPSGLALSLAVAAVSLAEGRLSAPPDGGQAPAGMNVLDADCELRHGSRLICLEAGAAGRHGWVTLSRHERPPAPDATQPGPAAAHGSPGPGE